jgi:hypothetical protein
MPITPGTIAGTAASSVLNNTLGNKGGVIAQVGKAAGSMLLGNMMNPYRNYGYSY